MNRYALARRLKYGTNAFLITGIVTAIAILIYGVVSRHHLRKDLTEDKSFSLSADTLLKLDLLERSGKKVKTTAFSTRKNSRMAYVKNRQVEDLLKEYTYRSKNFDYTFIDYDKERLTAEKLGVKNYGTVVFQSGDKRVDVLERDIFRSTYGGPGKQSATEFRGEHAFTNAILKVTSDTQKTIYFLEGHGERGINDRDPDGLSDLKDFLQNENYEVKSLNLFQPEKENETPGKIEIPEDATVLVLARPMAPFFPEEENAVFRYVVSGGKVLLLMEQGASPSLTRFLDYLGMEMGNGIVLDTFTFFPFIHRPVPQYRSHDITRELSKAKILSVLSYIAPIKKKEKTDKGIRFSPLLQTSKDGWVEMNLKEKKPHYTEGEDVKGPVTMAAAVNFNTDKKTISEKQKAGDPLYSGLTVRDDEVRAVVFGDSDLAANGLIQSGPGNLSLLLNTFKWLAGDKDLISIQPKSPKFNRLNLTKPQQKMVKYLCIFTLPLLIVVTGFGVWFVRR